MEPKPGGDQFRDDALRKAQMAIRQQEAEKRLSGEVRQVAEGIQDMSDQDAETRNQNPQTEQAQERPLGPTEELIAEHQAKAIIEAQEPSRAKEVETDQQPPAHEVNHTHTALQEQQLREEQERRDAQEREGQAQREAEANRSTPNQQHHSSLEAPQNEGISTHPMRDSNPMSPAREQHQQALGEDADRGGVQRTINTRTKLGVVVTMEGLYVVPKYETRITEKPIREKGQERPQADKAQGGEKQISYLRELARTQRSRPPREKDKTKDRDKGMER